MNRPIWPGQWVLTLERVAECAFEMCQWLDMYEGSEHNFAGLPEGMKRAHDRLHESLEPYERVKYSEAGEGE